MCLSLSRSTPNTYITYKKGAVLWENVTPLLAVILTVLAALFPPLSKTCHGPALVSPSSVLRLFHQPQSGLFSKGLFISYIPQFFWLVVTVMIIVLWCSNCLRLSLLHLPTLKSSVTMPPATPQTSVLTSRRTSRCTLTPPSPCLHILSNLCLCLLLCPKHNATKMEFQLIFFYFTFFVKWDTFAV